MIIRSLRLRHGRIALPRQLPIRRYQSSLESSGSGSGSGSQGTETAAEAEGTSANTPVAIPIFNAPTAQQDATVQTTIREVPLTDPNHPVALDYAFYLHQKRVTANVGTSIASHYQPRLLVNNPPRPSDITLELLIASQTHIGHSTSLWNPANARYIFGVRGEHDPIHIISPDVTAAHLRRACKVVSGVAERGGLILFVGTRQGQARAVVRAAELSKGCHLFTKWIPGTITNGQQILGRCEKMVVNEKDEEVTGFEDQLGAKAAIKPDLVVCLNPLENYILLHECGMNNIPTIGIIDTDANPTWVTYPIPANDDSLRAVQVIAGVLGRAGEAGQQKRLDQAFYKGKVVSYPSHGLTAPEGSRSDNQRTSQPRQRRATLFSRSGGNTSSTPSRRQEPPSIEDQEARFPDDYENVDVRQSEADEELLNAAEKTLAAQHQDFSSSTKEGVEGAAAIPTAEEMADMPSPEDDTDSHTLDPSLTDDNYATSEQLADEQDLAQFGIHADRTESTKQDATGGEGESTFEQVAEVEQELGEEAPESEVRGDSDAAKPEEPVKDKKI